MKNLMLLTILSSLSLLSAPAYSIKGVAQDLNWTYEGTDFSGYYLKGKKNMPGIVIYHQWLGLSQHEKDIAKKLNKLGYTVLAADVYGKDNRPQDREGAKQIAGSFYQDRMKLRNNANAALEAFLKESGLKSSQTYVIGYCFGGSTILELGRTAIPLKGLVSLHGGLTNPNPDDDQNIQGPVLILHGAEDQSVTMDDVTAFISNMRKFKKDFSVHIFAHAVHGFTHKHDASRYNKEADEQSWSVMLDFFKKH